MKKRMGFSLLAVLAVMFVSGCKQEELPNTYIEGTDFQYMQQDSQTVRIEVQQGNGGVYLVENDYVYYMEEGAEKIVPLCNKADCFHDRETDEEKKKECNAYTESLFEIQEINYYDGYVYYLTHNGPESTLYRISADGSRREKIYYWDFETDGYVDKWMIHRGKMYYTSYKNQIIQDKKTGEELIKQWYSMSSLPLEGTLRRPTVIYSQKEELQEYNVSEFGQPKAYGNYLYFHIWAYKETEEEITNDNFLEYLYWREMVYDISTGELKEFHPIETTESQIIQIGTFWQDKVTFVAYDFSKPYLSSRNIYIGELDGSGADVLLTDVPQGYVVRTDGEKLYLTNDFMIERGIEEGDRIFWIYNSEMELVDTCCLPDDKCGTKPIGGAQYQYIKVVQEEGFEVWKWDKGKIGSYQGSTIDLTKIKYDKGQ